ncbi:MAG: Isoquinoline 1-oxidoreductase subunit [Proteobacteria bacterium]|nr:MAG: Isoquinoline 1-oxidoreductase subunit [Pseudomonadota bacterium]
MKYAVKSVVFVTLLNLFNSSLMAQDKERSIAAFMEASKVFKHPRCLNCHPAADHPTQGDDLHPHIMNVQRGPDDKGLVAQRCETCHQKANYQYSEVPGGPKWALAPRSMAWQGLSDRDLCKTILDPKKNHGMSHEKLIEHNAKDPLVAWAWNPGSDREPAPGTQEEFGKHVREWIENGAACPGD